MSSAHIDNFVHSKAENVLEASQLSSEGSTLATSLEFYGEDCYEHPSANTCGLIYIEESVPGPGIDEDLWQATPAGCTCVGQCDSASCACVARSNGPGRFSPTGKPLGEISASFPVFECNASCRCASLLTCLNRASQRGPRRYLSVQLMADKGLGVLTTKALNAGDFVCEYAGEIIGEAEAKGRMRVASDEDANYILVMRETATDVPSTSVTIQNVTMWQQTIAIDPTVCGNIGRYLNHSCDPNLVMVPVRSESLIPRAALFARRNVRAGQELSYHYGSAGEGEMAQSPIASRKRCLCESLKCAGFLPKDSSL